MWKAKWLRVNHRLTVHPRTLAREILAELKVGSTAIMRYYEQHGYVVDENESVIDLITRTVQAHVVYGEPPSNAKKLKRLRELLKEWLDGHTCIACDSDYPKHKPGCLLKEEIDELEEGS